MIEKKFPITSTPVKKKCALDQIIEKNLNFLKTVKPFFFFTATWKYTLSFCLRLKFKVSLLLNMCGEPELHYNNC